MTAPFTPKKERAGVTFRRQQLAEASRERGRFEEEGDTAPITGNVSTRQDVQRKKASLQRLLNALKKRGESQYEGE